MKTVNWRIKEEFVFPSEIGSPTAAEDIQVTPRFTEETVEGRPKLTGIYHIAVTVNLTGGKVENYEIGESVVIDDLDLNEDSGYFEYALPFNIDFPPEAENPVTISALNPTYEIEGHRLAILWDIECTYKEAGLQKQNEKANETQVKKANEELVDHKGQDEQKVQVTQKSEESESTSKAAEVVVETSSSSEEDEVLDFIAELEDGISATSFRLNDILL